MLKSILIAVVAIAAFSAAVGGWLATRPAAPKPFASAYHDALREYPGSDAAIAQGLENFARIYGELAHPEIGQRIKTLYAESMYFSDSLKIFHAREPLVEYMRATGAMLVDSGMEVDQVVRDGKDVFVRWTLEFSAGSASGPLQSRSVGMSHLRFDDRGRVVLHQDFWDSAAGLYRNLPVVGYALDQVDKRIAQ